MKQRATCHPDRLVEARGLCRACYAKAWRRGLLSGFAKCQPTSDRRAYWREKKRMARLTSHSH